MQAGKHMGKIVIDMEPEALACSPGEESGQVPRQRLLYDRWWSRWHWSFYLWLVSGTWGAKSHYSIAEEGCEEQQQHTISSSARKCRLQSGNTRLRRDG